MGLEKIYINQDTINRMNNYQLLKYATEQFTQLMYFLETYRNKTNIKFKIGNFSYDDWTADLFCCYNENGLIFKHIRREDKKEWSHHTLTEQLIYAWGFEKIKFNINFDIINDFWKLLNEKEKENYDDLYDEVHSKYW